MSSDGHGIPDNAAMAAHQVIGHADQTQHQDELERKRNGLSDQAVNNERTFIQGAERRASHGDGSGVGSKIKQTINKLVPGSS